MTMEYEINHEICNSEQVNREIRDWDMTMEYDIDPERLGEEGGTQGGEGAEMRVVARVI